MPAAHCCVSRCTRATAASEHRLCSVLLAKSAGVLDKRLHARVRAKSVVLADHDLDGSLEITLQAVMKIGDPGESAQLLACVPTDV